MTSGRRSYDAYAASSGNGTGRIDSGDRVDLPRIENASGQDCASSGEDIYRRFPTQDAGAGAGMQDNGERERYAAYANAAVPNPGEPDMVVIRERKRTRKRKKKPRSRRIPVGVKILVGVLVALVAGAGAAYAFISYNVAKGDEQLHVEPAPEIKETGELVSYGGHEYRYNDNVVALMVMGKDDESTYGTERSCTDANILVTLDTQTKVLNVIAIPRDSIVDVDLYDGGAYVRTGRYQLAVAYGVDVPTEDDAAHNTMRSVSKLFYSMPVERYFVLEMDAVAQLSSAVGGVKVEALDTYPGAEFEVGDTVVLEGESALKYVRYRDVDIDKSAQTRQERQMQFVKAFLDKLRKSDVSSIMELYNTVQETTLTNLDMSDIAYLASVFVDGRATTTDFVTLVGETKLELDDDEIEREHIYLDEKSVKETALAAFYVRED